jgi:hypothetical protein
VEEFDMLRFGAGRNARFGDLDDGVASCFLRFANSAGAKPIVGKMELVPDGRLHLSLICSVYFS